MAEYIERDKVIKELEWYIERFPDCAECLEAIKHIIAYIPAADVRPVVLCRDCMLRQYCKVAQYLGEDGFCSSGEKREES